MNRTAARPRRKFLQFGIRSLLGLTLFCCLKFYWIFADELAINYRTRNKIGTVMIVVICFNIFANIIVYLRG